MKIISQGNLKDLNLFTSVFSNSNTNEDDLFEFDLFGLNGNNTNNEKKDEDFINIERSKNDIKIKVSQTFDNFDDQKKEDDDEDDLLDLMDKNI